MESNWNALEAAIEAAMPADRFRLRRRLRSLRAAMQREGSAEQPLAELALRVQQSVELRQARRDNVPRIEYDATLPIFEKKAEIAAAIAQSQVVIVCGETGSGKSTQLPKICLEMGRGIDAMIGHTQPRRIAARTIATRLAQELNVTLGQQVGYKIRFADRSRPETYIKVMTDGILLAETQGDRFFDQYDTIIIDEAHERSLNIDFLLGYIKRLLPRRPDLRVIITSATLDAARFASHFSSPRGHAPVIEVSGRTYPVEVRYRPLVRGAEDTDLDQQQAIVQAVEELTAEGSGDILVFLPTERDIRETARTLRGWSVASGQSRQLEILPLYARLTVQEQQKIFAPHSHRRIVLATNVAESSLTVPEIRYVIDTGTARISRYSPRAKVQRLPIEAISQASADQRKGRCGRLGPGICIRLYSEDDFLTRDRYTTPEIRRTNLSSVILQTKALKLGEIEQFPFLDPPRPEAIRDGYNTLFELGAIHEDRSLTELGRELSRLPVDPRIGRMVLAADHEGCLAEVIVIAAALEVQDPRDRPVEKQQAADEAHRRFADERSDFLAYLKLWDFYHQLKADLSRQQLRKACVQNFLSLSRMRDWAETYRQLRQLVEQSGRKVGTRRDDYAAIHRALMTGLLSGIAYRSEAYQYTGAGGNKTFLWPGSGTFAKRPKWIIAAEIVETSRRYARTVGQVDPDWIEPLALHLVKRRYVAPFWSRRRGAAMVHEKVSLFGMPIVTSRPVPLGPIDPENARKMFIQHGLVEGDFSGSFRFLDYNRRLVRKIQNMAAKSRRTDWIIAEAAQYAFYDLRLPKDVYDLNGMRQWLPAAERENKEVLRLKREDLLPDQVPEVPEKQFPDELQLHDARFPLEYRFQPGDPADGVTVVVPKQLVNELTAEQFEWLVPGRLEEKIAALIRSLPKATRRLLVPAPDTARQIVNQLQFGEGPFLKRLAKVLERRAGVPIPVNAFRLEELPTHLRMNFRIVDEQGATVAAGRNFEEIVRRLTGRTDDATTLDVGPWSRDDIKTWNFPELPESVELDYGGIPIRRYPTLSDRGDSVSLRLIESKSQAERQLRRGLRRLFALAEQRELRTQVAWLPRLDEIRLFATGLPGGGIIDQHIADLLAERAFLQGPNAPRSAEQFQERLEHGRDQIPLAVQDVTALLYALFSAYHEARRTLEEQTSSRWAYVTEDVHEQMAELVKPGFLTDVPWEWLQQYPKYFRAMVYRFERLQSGGLSRDERNFEELKPFLNTYRRLAAEQAEFGIEDEQLSVLRWMLEEWRVSLFAQHLGTVMPVSAKRIERQLAQVQDPSGSVESRK